MKHLAHPLVVGVLLSLSVQVQAACLDTRPSVFAGTVDSTVPNQEVGGVCMNDLIVDAAVEGANWGNHGAFVSAVSGLTRGWMKAKAISNTERSRIVSAAAQSDVGATLLVKIAAINDFHGQLFSPGSFSGKPVGGIDALAAYVNVIRAKSPNSVAVSAGDLIGATPLVSALFHDEPTIEGMNILGLDINAVGNHEFDEGRDELLRMQNGGCHPTDPNSCQGNAVGTPFPFEGARFKFLAANVTEKADGKTLFPAYAIKNFQGNKVAFVGMTLEATPSIVTPSGISTLDFRDEADTVNALIPELKAQGVETVVVLIHEGGRDATGSVINDCSKISGAILDIVQRLDDAVDLVVSGHTHQAYLCSLPNSAGRNIPVTSTNAQGRTVTEIDLTINTRTRDVASIAVDNVLVDRSNAAVTPVAALTTLADNYNALAAPLANTPLGSITAAITRSNNAAGESALGDVIADAQLEATAAPELGGAVIAVMNPGGMRADFTYPSSAAGEGDGVVTYGEAFNVQPFGNSLVTKTFSGQQIVDLLEQQWGALQPFARILQVSNGLSYQHTFDTMPASFAAQKGGQYVCDGSVKLNGVAIDKLASYRVTMNSFLASGGDNFTVFNQGTAQLGGALDLDAMQQYFTAHDPVAPGAQDRIARLETCPAP
ncbi:bifunctional metallophosphatase/5'-nucleotidase [Thiobacillus denitrificans]|uniref:5'-nucleotidase n=1 Tax=Thiobacillus denitrificans TaxID=36861 RepID=A0A106BMB9_THIDE|nr:bifunctional metallophosphatase/5'-nucleotidase [Thiobacillus denitrificans]KVW95122.1 5'-nucleotidase [Thiobacillus denitrificans]